jgi:hypothetical protein
VTVKVAIVIVLTAVVPTFAFGQQPSASAPASQFESVPSREQVRALLQSGDSRSQAWGAWWTAQAQMLGMEPLLQKNLEEHKQGQTALDEAVMDQTLDAYIQNSGDLPPVELLKSVFPRRPSQSLILFSRLAPSPSVDQALLELLPTEEGRGGTEWYAIADLLLAHRSQGFAASLLRNINIRGQVDICDPGDCEKVTMSFGPMSMGGEGMLPMFPVPGVPPWPIYTLQRIPDTPAVSSRSNIPFVSGPVSIAYHRRIGPAGLSPSELQSSHGWQFRPEIPTTGDRLKYLTAGFRFTNLPREFEYLSIPWMGAENFIAEMGRFRRDIRQRHDNLLQLLLSGGFLTADEAASVRAPVIDISVSDLRAAKTPLPDIQAR